jgi:hypothetical protein
LTLAEQALAQALEEIFATGTHAWPALAAALQSKGIARPSGAREPWTEASLEAELSAINRALDQAYAKHGIGA